MILRIRALIWRVADIIMLRYSAAKIRWREQERDTPALRYRYLLLPL